MWSDGGVLPGHDLLGVPGRALLRTGFGWTLAVPVRLAVVFPIALALAVFLALVRALLHGEQLRADGGRAGLPEPRSDLRQRVEPGDGAVEHVHHAHAAPDRAELLRAG